jgi:hypothetical protein
MAGAEEDLPPKSTANCYFMISWYGTREQKGREARPTTAIIDSQSAKAARLRLFRIAS